MNEIVNKFSLAGDKFMPEMYLKQPGFTYSACGPVTKNKERTQKFKEKEIQTNKNELDKACFQHDMAYGNFKGLARRTASDKVLGDKASNIAKNPEYDVSERRLTSMVYNFFDKKAKGSGIANDDNNNDNNNKWNIQVPKGLHKPIIKRTIYSGYKDNIWGADLADKQV